MSMPVTQSGHWATFLMDREQFAVPVEAVQEVLLMQPLTPIPMAPPQFVGLLNLRGTIMPAIDVRVRLGYPPPEARLQSKLIVLKTPEGLVSMVVDEIGDVLELPGSGWHPVPDTLAARHRDFVFGIFPLDGQVLLGLKAALLVSDDANDDVPIAA